MLKNKLSKKHQSMIESIQPEPGLIDNCKYMVYLNSGFEHVVFGDSFPVKNITELRSLLSDVNDDLI